MLMADLGAEVTKIESPTGDVINFLECTLTRSRTRTTYRQQTLEWSWTNRYCNSMQMNNYTNLDAGSN